MGRHDARSLRSNLESSNSYMLISISCRVGESEDHKSSHADVPGCGGLQQPEWQVRKDPRYLILLVHLNVGTFGKHEHHGSECQAH